MSLFNIKIKTKSGNDIKKKQTMTVFFRVAFKNNGLTKTKTAEFTYRIMHENGVQDPKRVLGIKNTKSIKSVEDLTLKVLLNMCHILSKLSEVHTINPDFIMFVSPDLDGKKNKSWLYMKALFSRSYDVTYKKEEEFQIGYDDVHTLQKHYQLDWNKQACEKLGIDKEDLDKLKTFVDLNPNTKFMNVDPNIDKVKYAKSINVCEMLQERMDRKFQNDIDY